MIVIDYFLLLQNLSNLVLYTYILHALHNTIRQTVLHIDKKRIYADHILYEFYVILNHCL